ncbi:MAG: SocA family protein [Proteobacteria bacterium]|nr:SocA family protein [Pseudomonadota bacterium]MBU4471312.1 SocA family protein [Pseudomonadota bacterium]MCG2751683.1 SocA family protein [Desulfobacteraceae bacterium]
MFAEKSGGQINKMKAIKLVFFADRHHLRKYGRPITNDEYYAMDFGPVPSGSKDIAELSEFLSGSEAKYASEYIEVVDRYRFKSKKPSDLKVLSESDLEALAFAWDKFSGLDKYELVDLTHKLPEWKKHENGLKDSSRLKMNYEDFFENPPDCEQCHIEVSEEDRVDLIGHLKEMSRVEAMWS